MRVCAVTFCATLPLLGRVACTRASEAAIGNIIT